MKDFPNPMPPEIYLDQMFNSKSAQMGGVVRRKVRDVERILGREAFGFEIRKRGFHAIENGGQFVIFCNNQDVRIVC